MAFYGYNGDVHWGAADHDFEAASYYSPPYLLSEPNPIPLPIDYYNHDYYSVSTYSDPINYASSYDYYQYSVNQSETNYSQPKYLQYDPSPPYQAYFPTQTKSTVSYSKVQFSMPEFEDYDPTPYGGGYDQAMTYGKPLPPSDLTCYPRSLPQSDAPPLDNFSFASIPSPYGRDEDIIATKPPDGSKPTDTKPETGSRSGVENEGKIIDDGKDVEPIEVIPIVEQSDYPNYEHQNGRVPQIPYGSGLETMDLCEGLFGYWPCLAKKAQQQRNCCQVCDPDQRIDPWKSAADYLFGTPLPYDYDNYHHHHQSLYQSDQISWLH
ncbi:uncharacterized protein LOC130985710 [Salvia miltiorrhiza]|uniref:uncharacterized protein LOC130985710 n=1 Tax=Salvia miltiorrhiza TaxID=226208 RepID=UPI0025AC75EC|nr:uncharacterized protein LOC130985710 [Salvia miltiorrhiza]